MKKLICVFIAVISIGKYSQAQVSSSLDLGRDLFFVSYEIAIPTNSDYLTKTSWSGARFEYRRMLMPNVSVGAGVSFNAFDQYFAKQTYQRRDGTGAVTGDMIRQVYTSPVTVSAQYYMQGKMLKPYLGLGLGVEYSEQNAYFNIYNINATNWGFVVRPEFGLIAKFSPNVSGLASIAYNFSTNSNDDFKIDNLSHIPINIGLVFTPR